MRHLTPAVVLVTLLAASALAAPDRDPQSYVRASERAARAGKFSDALAILRDAEKLCPGHADLRAARARVRWLQDEPAQAENDLAEALQLDPKSAEAHVVRGEMLMKSEQLTKALEQFQRATELNPKHATAYLWCADANLALDAAVNAVRAATLHLEKVSPNDPAALVRRGHAHRLREQLESALADLTKAIEVEPQNAEAFWQRGLVHEKRRKFEEAVADFSKHLELRKDNPVAYRARANALSELERWPECVADLTRALAGRPKDIAALLLRGQAYLRLSQPDKALADFDRILSLERDHLSGLFGKGQALDRLGKTDEGIQQFTRVIELEPGHVTAYLNRAILYNRLDRGKEALDDATAAINLEPEFAPGYRIRGSFLSARGKFADAITDFDKAIQLSGSDPYAYLGRGIALRRSGKGEAALADFTKTIALNSKLRNAYTQRANLYLSLDRRAEARADYEAVTKLPADGEPDETHAYCKILVALCAGEYDKGSELADEFVADHEKNSDWLYDLACAYALAAQIVAKDEKLADRVERTRRYANRALDLLEQAVQHGYKNFTHMGVDYDFDSIRSEPRFKNLLEKGKAAAAKAAEQAKAREELDKQKPRDLLPDGLKKSAPPFKPAKALEKPALLPPPPKV